MKAKGGNRGGSTSRDPSAGDMARWIAILALIVFLLTVFGPILAEPVAGQANTSADYYNGSSTTVENASWMEDRSSPTLENTTHMLSRIAGVTIGAGEGAAGSLLIGLLAFAAVASITGTSDLGVVGGAVVGIVAIAALVEAGFAPGWMYVVVVFALGAVGAMILKRVIR